MIYIASKCCHAPKWRELDKRYPIKASWIYQAGPGETQDYIDLWLTCIQEAREAQAFIFYHEPGETPKGSLIELGIALASHVPCIMVGDFKASVRALVWQAESLETALERGDELCRRYHTMR